MGGTLGVIQIFRDIPSGFDEMSQEVSIFLNHKL